MDEKIKTERQFSALYLKHYFYENHMDVMSFCPPYVATTHFISPIF